MAASASNIRAGGAFVELFTKDGKLVAGLNRAAARVRAFGASISGIGQRLLTVGGLIAAPLLGAANLFSSMGDDVAKAAIRIGTTTEALSELRHAANLSGASAEELENGFRFMQRTITEAGQGSREAADNLRDLGLSFDDLRTLAPDQQLEALAEQFQRLPRGAAQTAAAMGVFGRAGTRLIPLLNSGAKGIREMREEARRLGFSISGEDARAAEAFNDALGRLWMSVKMLSFNVGGALAPALQDIAAQLTEAGARASRWIRENSSLIKLVAIAVAGLTAFGVALIVLGPALKAVAFGITLIGVAIKAVIAIVGILGTIIGALTTPLGLVLLSLDLLRGYLIASAVNANNTFGVLRQGFVSVAQTAITAWGGIRDAIAAGDWLLAGRIAMTGLRLAWRQTVSVMRTIWGDFTRFFSEVWNAAIYNAARLLVGIYEGAFSTIAGFAGQLPDTSGILAQLDQMENEDARARDRRRREEEAAAAAADRADIERLQRELNNQAGIAAILRYKRERTKEGVTLGAPQTDLSALGRGVEARGTFSAFAISGLGASSVTDRIARYTEETARNTRANSAPAFT